VNKQNLPLPSITWALFDFCDPQNLFHWQETKDIQ